MKRLFFTFNLLFLGLMPAALAQSIEETYEKAQFAFNTGKYNEAEIHIKNILKENSTHVATRLLFAELLIKQGNGSTATVELDFAKLKGVDQSRLTPLYAEAYLLQRKYPELLEFTESVETPNKEVQAKIAFFRGQAFSAMRKFQQAETLYRQAIGVLPNFQKAHLGLAQVSISQKKYTKGLAHIEKALSFLTPSENAWLMKASVLQKLGDSKGSLEAINKAIEISPDNLLSRLTRASVYISDEQYDLAMIDVDFIQNKIPEEPRARYLKALINASTGDNQGSTEQLSEVITTLSAVPKEIMKTTPGYYFLAGLTNFQYGKMKDARRYLLNYLKYEEFDLRAIRMLALIEMRNKEFDSAIRILSKANVWFNDDPETLTLLGAAHQEVGNFDKAEYYFKNVIDVLPNSSRPITNLARNKFMQGRYGEAIQELNKQLSKGVEQDEIKLLLIATYQKAGKLDKAKALVEQLIVENPDNVFLHLRLGNIVGLAGDIESAREHFNKVLALHPKNIDANIHLSRLNALEGNFSQAHQAISELLKDFPNNSQLISEVAKLMLMEKKIDEAIVWYKKAYSNNNDNIATLSALSQLLVAEGQVRETIDLLDEYLGRNPKDQKAFELLGEAWLSINETNKAIATFEAAAEEASNKAKAYMKIANIQMNNGQTKEAQRTFTKAIVWDENYLPAYISLAQIAIAEKDEERATQFINDIKKLYNGETIADVLSGELHIALKQYAAAEKLLTKVLKEAPNRRALINLNKTFQQTEQYERSLRLLSNWLKVTPNDLYVELAFANALEQNKQIENARRVYESLIQKYKGVALIQNNFANFETQHSNYEKAIALATKATKVAPNNVDYLDTLAWAKFKNGEASEALSIYRKALLIDYNNAFIKYRTAIALKNIGRQSEAQKMLIEAIESQSEFKEKEAAKALLKEWLKS